MTTDQGDPNKTRLFEITGVIITVTVLFGILILVLVIQAVREKLEKKKRLQDRKRDNTFDPDDQVYNGFNLEELRRTGLL